MSKIQNLTPGSRWHSHTMQIFEVIRLTLDGKNLVVHYRRQHDGAEFNCYEGAFRQRFTPTLAL